MASIRREIMIEARSAAVWDAMRDVGALHTRLARGFVTDCVIEGGVRTVSFANGLSAKEQIITVDDQARRLVWSVVGGRLTHHNASTQVTPETELQSRVIWVCDLLPDELAPTVAGMIEHGMQAMKATLEADRADA
jgi:carbon monoxide dehydrogenase subunit G